MSISVLVYHILNSIEHRLCSFEDHRSWDTIRTLLSSYTRVTVLQRGKDGQIYRVRLNVTPKEEQNKETWVKSMVSPVKREIMTVLMVITLIQKPFDVAWGDRKDFKEVIFRYYEFTLA